MESPHSTRIRILLHRSGRAAALALALSTISTLLADDDVNEMLHSATTSTAPAPVTSPDAPENQPHSDALGTIKPKPPADARLGTITLSDGTKFDGNIWTTTSTPLRVWVEEDKSYHDIDLALIKQIDVHVLTETMEDDWRWLKEGSDQKVYSGKKYPNVELAYRFTLLNDQVIEGGVIAPIYVDNQSKTRTLALYKKYKGLLDETLKDLVYVKTITLAPPADSGATSTLTTKLPLLPA